MNKIFLFLIISISLISLANAQLIIQSQPMEISQKVNEEKSYTLTLQNTFDFPLSSFSFSGTSNYGLTFPQINLGKNETQSIQFTVNNPDSYHGQINSVVAFQFPVEIPEGVQTYEINLTDSGLNGINNHHQIIREGDTITWNNLADGTRTITSGLFNSGNLPLNQSFSHTFTSIGDFDYSVLIPATDVSIFYGNVKVINKTSQEKAHNPNYDTTWVINYNTFLNPTTLSVENSKSGYEIEYTKSDFGTIKIKNNGTELAELVTLSSNSDWVSFDKNNIDIEPGQERHIEYTIVPIVFETNDTGKNYEIDLKIKASNSEEVIKKINVFVKFKEIYFDENDPEYLLKLLENFCKRNPGNVFCNVMNTTGGNGTVIYKDVEIPLNLTATQFYDLLKRFQRIEDADARTTNKLTQLADKYGTSFPQIINQLNQSIQLSQESQKRSKNVNNSVWIIGFFLLIIGLIRAIIKIFNKKSYKKHLVEGGAFSYRR